MIQPLSARVDKAEALIAAGDWQAGFETYWAILRDDLVRPDTAEPRNPASRNMLLVLERFGDLAAEAGFTRIALNVYPKVAADGDSTIRIPALAKMLQLASSSGEPDAARVFRQLEQAVWSGPLPDSGDDPESAWPRGIGYETQGMVCLGMGCFFNSVRLLGKSGSWLRRGIRSFGPNAVERIGLIPLRLALANHFLTTGDFDQSEEQLRAVDNEIDFVSGGETYRMWLEDSAVRQACLRGNLAEALNRLDGMEASARARRLWGTLCRTFLARAEVFILLNQFKLVDACIDSCMSLPESVWTPELRAEKVRVTRYRRLRAGIFAHLEPLQAAVEMQGDAVAPAGPPSNNALTDPTEEIVWTGDVLRDYLRREAQVLETLDAASRLDSERWRTRALTALDDLKKDFETLPSRLIQARISLITGIIRQGTGGSGTVDLETARRLFAEIGARQDLWHATDFLIAGHAEPPPGLLEENDRRLDELSSSLGTDERSWFELNKYRQREWQWRLRSDQILNLRAAAYPEEKRGGWWPRIRARLMFLSSLDRLVWDLDEEKLERRPGYKGRKYGYSLIRLVSRLLLRNLSEFTVGYLVLPDFTLMYWSGWGRFDCIRLPIGRLQVESIGAEMHSALVEDERKFRPVALRACANVGLHGIVASASNRIGRLAIVTDEMSTLPFCALRFESPSGAGRYLAERFAVRISGVSEEPGRFHRKAPTEAISAFYAGGLASDPALPRAGEAAKNAACWFRERWRSVTTVTTDVTECLKALPRSAAFFYFGHGEFSAGAAGTGLGFAHSDGKRTLSIEALDHVDLSNMEQATIMACRSGDAVVTRGRWTAGLPQLMWRRGARSVIASVWQADEEMAAELAGFFLNRAPVIGRAEALREFQTTKIAGKGLHSDPIYWATFQIYGEGGPLRPPRRQLWQRTSQH